MFKLVHSLNANKEPDVDLILSTLNNKLNATLDVLLNHEMQCVDQYQDTIKDAIANYTEHASSISEYAQGFFSTCRELENEFQERFVDLVSVCVDKLLKMGDDMEERVRDVRFIFFHELLLACS